MTKTHAIIVLAAALLGAVMAVPSIFLAEVLGLAILFAALAIAGCLVAAWRQRRTTGV